MTTRTKKRKRSNSTQIAFTRFMLIVGVFAIWILGISVKLVHLPVTQHEWLKEKAVDQRQDIKKSKMLRGTTYDRDNRALAMSIKVKTLYADATEIVDPSATARAIAKTLKLDANHLTKQLTESKARCSTCSWGACGPLRPGCDPTMYRSPAPLRAWLACRWQRRPSRREHTRLPPVPAGLAAMRAPCTGLEFQKGIAVTSSNNIIDVHFDTVRFEQQVCYLSEIRPVDYKALQQERRDHKDLGARLAARHRNDGRRCHLV